MHLKSAPHKLLFQWKYCNLSYSEALYFCVCKVHKGRQLFSRWHTKATGILFVIPGTYGQTSAFISPPQFIFCWRAVPDSMCWSLKVLQPSLLCRLAQCARKACDSTADQWSKNETEPLGLCEAFQFILLPPRCWREMGLCSQVVFTILSS